MKAPRVTAPRATAGLLVVLALALGQWLHQQLPAAAESARPYEQAVAVGESVRLRSGMLEVLSVDGAPSVRPHHGTGLVSPGVFVVLEFTFTPHATSSDLTYGEWRDARGRVVPFFGSGRSSLTCPGRLVDRPVRCLAVVEADPDTVAGGSIAIGASQVDERWDSLAVVDLGVDDAQVRSWLDRGTPLTLPETGTMTRTEAS